MKTTLSTAIVILLVALSVLGIRVGGFLRTGIEPFGYFLIAFLIFGAVITLWLNSYVRQHPRSDTDAR
jgi:hypothetical protein